MKGELLTTGAGMAMILLLGACGGGVCAAGGMCACPREYCGDEYIFETDNGKAFNLQVGQEIVERLADRLTPVEAYTTDPSVLKQVSEPKKEFVSRQEFATGFIAVGTGSAHIGMVYQQCEESAQSPCRFEFLVNVVRFPKTTVAVQALDHPTVVTLRVGESARISAPSDRTDRWSVVIDNPSILRWSVEPLVMPNLLEGVIEATGVGTAHLSANLQAGQEPWWGNSWKLTVKVVS